nr:Putative uncharacterized protein [Moritella viscosa]
MSFNRYVHVNNNPYKYTDRNGEFLWGVAIGAGIELVAKISKIQLDKDIETPPVRRGFVAALNKSSIRQCQQGRLLF